MAKTYTIKVTKASHQNFFTATAFNELGPIPYSVNIGSTAIDALGKCKRDLSAVIHETVVLEHTFSEEEL